MVQKHVNLVIRSRQDLSSEYLLAKIGVDKAETEPLKVHFIFKLWDLIFTEPPRPRTTLPAFEAWCDIRADNEPHFADVFSAQFEGKVSDVSAWTVTPGDAISVPCARGGPPAAFQDGLCGGYG